MQSLELEIVCEPARSYWPTTTTDGIQPFGYCTESSDAAAAAAAAVIIDSYCTNPEILDVLCQLMQSCNGLLQFTFQEAHTVVEVLQLHCLGRDAWWQH
jgi:hypothetical protein